MAEATRAFDAPGVGRGGIFIAILVILIIVGLFFIPEIIQFQKSLWGSSTASGADKKSETKIAREQKKGDAENSITPSIDAPSTLDTLSLYLDKKSDKKDAPTAQEESRASLATVALKQESQGLQQPQVQKQKQKSTEPAWDQILTPESKNTLGRARGAALAIAHQLPAHATQSRYALVNFASGVGIVVDHGSEVFHPREAIDYITSLDDSVSRAMATEKVDRSLMIAWSKIDLGPGLVMSPRPAIPPFNPKLTITWVDMRQAPLREVPNPKSPLQVSFGGYVIGDDVTRLEVANPMGTTERSLTLPHATEGGYRLFLVNFGFGGSWQGAPITLRLFDKFGNVFEKTYKFAPAGDFAYSLDGEKYILPYRQDVPFFGRFSPWAIDPRMDARFKVGTWRGTIEQLQKREAPGGQGEAFADSAEGKLFNAF